MITILYYGARNTGVAGLLYLAASGYDIQVSDDSDEDVLLVARLLKLKVVYADLALSTGIFDYCFCVHGTRIIEPEYLKEKRFVNFHPCLSLGYKGRNPVKKYLDNKNTIATIDSHFMVEKIDEGELIHSQEFETGVVSSYAEFYNIALINYYLCFENTLKKLGI